MVKDNKYSLKEFSPRTDFIILFISFTLLILSCILVVFSGSMLEILGHFLEEKVFHREFNISKWKDTIYSLLVFPVFFLIFIDSVLFIKLRKVSKIILIFVYSFIILFFICLCAFLRCNDFMDADMASEIILAKECFLNKTFLPRSWDYATEIRMLNNQLISAPLFLFTNNWVIIKGLTVLFSSLTIPLTLLFLLNQINIKSLWVKLFCCLISIAPWSFIHWDFLQFGGYYIPHVSIAFLTVGLFFGMIKNNKMHNKRLFTFYCVCYCILSLHNGLSGIRYLVQFHLPLFLTIVPYYIVRMFKNEGRVKIKDLLVNNKPVYYACIGLAICIVGFVLNTMVIYKIFSIKENNVVDRFNNFGAVTIESWLGAIFSVLGFRGMVSYTSPAGFVDILIYVFVVLFLMFTCYYIKLKTFDINYFVVIFAVVSFVFNAFINVNVTFYKSRYFLTYIFWIIPCIAIFIEEQTFLELYRFIFGVVCGILFLTSTFLTYVTVLSTSINGNTHELVKFLKDSDYDYGYSIFWTGNNLTFLTNGKIEFVNFYDNNFENVEFDKHAWLVSKRIYDYNYKRTQKLILVLENSQLTEGARHIYEKGRTVYSDQYYSVFEYQDKDALRAAVESK